MDRYEFINELQRHLTGKVSVQKLKELTDYYNDHIDSEIRKGNTEEEVLKNLGNPRLLAKSILMAEESQDAYEEYESDRYENDSKNDSAFTFNGKVIPKWKFKTYAIIAIIILALILFSVVALVGLALSLIFKILFRIILPIGIIYLIYVLIFEK